MHEGMISGKTMCKLIVHAAVIASAWLIAAFALIQISRSTASYYEDMALPGPVLFVFLVAVSFTAAYAGYRTGLKTGRPSPVEEYPCDDQS